MTAPETMEQAFLADIVAHPDDPSLWLILADWLDEHEDPRGELVRLTWQLQHEAGRPDFATREARVQALLAGGLRPLAIRLDLDFEFAWLPPGSFWMGSTEDEEERADEARHRVRLTEAFWMGVHAVTQAQWRAVMGKNPSAFKRRGSQSASVRSLASSEVDRLPVESVSWNEAVEFCARLSQRLGRRVALPTEAQWEYACRAGTTTAYHFGPALNGTQANCDGGFPYGTPERGPYLRRPVPVGSFPPNAWGLYEMHGNVWEWCADAYRPDYETLGEIDPVDDTPDAERRSGRGGSWFHRAVRCRSASRVVYSAHERDDILGLRVCLPTR